MTITLTPELEQIVKDQLATGQFASADEVVAVSLLRIRQQYEELKSLIAVGEEDIRNGRVGPLDVRGTLAALRAKKLKLNTTGDASCDK